jgi:hypothetical protein
LIFLEADQQQLPLRIECELHVQRPTADDRLVDILSNCRVDLGWHRLVEVRDGQAGNDIDHRLLVHARLSAPSAAVIVRFSRLALANAALMVPSL